MSLILSVFPWTERGLEKFRDEGECMKKFLITTGIVLIAAALILCGLWFYLSKKPAVPSDYVSKTQTGGEIEAKYLADGPDAVSVFEQKVVQNFKKYEIFYPPNWWKRIESTRF